MEMPESTKETLAYKFHTTLKATCTSLGDINEAIRYYIDKRHIVFYQCTDSNVCLLFGDGSAVLTTLPSEESPTDIAVLPPSIVAKVLAQGFPFDNIDGCQRTLENIDEPA